MPRQVGIFGGSFDPPHLGHLIAAQAAYEALGLDLVLFVPTGNAYHKAPGSQAADRLAMTERAIAGDRRFAVSRLEVDRAGPSYTIDTVTALRAQHPDAQFTLILGSDAFRDLPHWHRSAELQKAVRIAVVTREEALPPEAVAQPRCVTIAPIGISSSQCRRRVREGLGVNYLVPEAVAGYIEEHSLYRGETRE